jgi:hypothetical protein
MSVEPAMAKPIPAEIMRNMIGMEMEIEATAAAPSRPTQKASIIW